MAMTVADLKALATRYRTHAEIIGVSLFALIVFVMLGAAARRKVSAARADVTSVTATEREISSFRSAFKASSAPEPVALPDSFAIAVPRVERVSLAGNLASRAELAGLSNVRVKFTAPDSAAAPEKPDLFASTVAVADYGLSVDGDGGFAQALSFVNQLPPSVAVQRITAVHDKGGSHFHVMLAVFETAEAAQHG